VISEVGYINDFAEHDKVLAEQIVHAQQALATIHATVERPAARPRRSARRRSSRSRSSTPSSSS
jgi:hypothetical protein